MHDDCCHRTSLSSSSSTLSAHADVLRAFLTATAEGYAFAAAHPQEAAAVFCAAVAAEYASTPLPDGVPSQQLVQRSLEEIGKV